ncbi:2,' 3'-cyclic nucleotide 2'-phosphodiesterase [Filobacillus milosensis]|uniref:2,' 3'-cyclic nucleotide 2'-phosphodiesterase n=2 Tax=Filobacillus milosensis TaxID=94137 RepID=A0A4Y8IEF2_9BACI|nr:2,' 3'-cyclic nucleotide 2'-phosphodiesterase [Filobacillus milosensis]
MKKKFFLIFMSFSIILPIGSLYAEDDDYVSVQLLGVNDLHGQIDYESYFADFDGDGEEDPAGRADYLASYLKEREADNPENTLVVNSGDMIGGSPLVSAAFQDEPTVEIMEAMGMDVGTLGNHEFDEGVDELLRMINGGDHPNGTEGYDGMDFANVAANVQYKDTKELLIDPYVVKEVGGQKIGFIGVVTTETPNMVIKEGNENVEFTDEVEAINKYVPELKEQGVKSIVVLAHNPGFQEGETITGDAARIANNVDDEVDVIFAAHNHVENNGYVDGKLIVQAYSYGTAFSDVDLKINATTGDIVDAKAEIVTVAQHGMEPNEEVAAILQKYEDKVAEIKNEVIGEAKTELIGGYAERGEVGDNALGNLIADGMKWAMDADFALMNGGGIRANIDQGDITYGEVFTVQPFGNVLNKVELTGADLEQVLNNQISEQYGPDYSVAGFNYTWQDATQEVVNIYLPDGTKIDPDENYTVVVNNYMYGDTDSEIEKLSENMVVGPTDLDATVDYIKTLEGPIEYREEGRISEVELELPFSDISASDQAYKVLYELAEQGVFKGVYEGKFNRNKPVTRAEFVQLLNNALELESDGNIHFTDVEGDRAAAIDAAYDAGIIAGRTEDKFVPNGSMTRAEMITVLTRAYKYVTNDEVTPSEKSVFSDAYSFSWAKSAILQGHALGLVEGYPNGQFKPFSSTSRVEAAYVIYNWLNILE